jgi:transposase
MNEEAALPGLEDMVQAEAESTAESVGERKRRYEYINREQLVFRTIDVEQLIPEDHPARAIWEFLGQVDLSAFETTIKAYEDGRGRAAYEPRLLISLWVYAYSRGEWSGREISRLCETDPAYQWLTGMKSVNYHSLTSFRVQHEVALRKLFTQILAVFNQAGLVSLERVMNDGTKIRTQASKQSLRSQDTISEHLQAARERVAAMEQAASAEENGRTAKARQRAAREYEQRLTGALAEFDKLQAKQGKTLLVSKSEPEARKMKQADGGYAPSYNVQLSTEQSHGIIVGVGLGQSAADYQELAPAMQRVEDNLGSKPKQVVVDGGYLSGANLIQMEARGIELITPINDNREQLKRRGIAPEFGRAAFDYDEKQNCFRCPAGETLTYKDKQKRAGQVRYRYQAQAAVCQVCPWRPQCCPQAKRGRSVTRYDYDAEMLAHLAKMETPAAREIYKQRGQTAEFPIAWIKEKIGLRRFHVRGMLKAELEAIWAAATYNIQQWIRLCWRPVT